MEITEKNNDIIIAVSKNDCNLAVTLDCGQCFRFKADENGFHGIVKDKPITLSQSENHITFHNTTKADFENFWESYFDFDTDYDELKKQFCEDSVLKTAVEHSGGIHILKQDSFEALISFMISQNNNIPRIKGSIERLCKRFGDEISENEYAFPTVEQLSDKKSDYADLGLGYREEYLADCVSKIKNAEIDLKKIHEMPIDEARKTLRTIKGVGPKVADCVLLFGFYQTEAFPIDTWIKKVLKEFYPNGFPEKYKPVSGIAQQFLFHYMRTRQL